MLYAAEQTAKQSSLAPHLSLVRPDRASTTAFAASVEPYDSSISGTLFNVSDPSVESLLYQAWLE